MALQIAALVTVIVVALALWLCIFQVATAKTEQARARLASAEVSSSNWEKESSLVSHQESS